MDAAFGAKLFNQLPGFLFSKETAGLNRINEQLQLRKLKVPGGDVIAAVFTWDGNDIHTVILQRSNVGINGLPLAEDPPLLQHFNELRGANRMVCMGIALEIVQNIENLQLLVVGLRHDDTLLDDLVHYITPIASMEEENTAHPFQDAPFAFFTEL